MCLTVYECQCVNPLFVNVTLADTQHLLLDEHLYDINTTCTFVARIYFKQHIKQCLNCIHVQ